ncbi:asparaginase [Bradyrhizobium sp. CB82]|uniref:asparaginase n=1 Tax=Bradyrhizobium sp. CB82 TaxID=3039159 RepID=UPI0024B1E633|nr:asparaginase [Bradyrhizobium sp. CB82]WFU44618.1 asparaginase [Bradyrhizobium sp. CB82]
MFEERSKSRPRVVVVGTGGTIASSATVSTDFHNYDVSDSIEQILAAVPEAAELADLCGVQAVNISSHRIDNSILLSLARRVSEALDDPGTDGVVITHGTDTLEETAYFLHLVLRTTKPVVVVGAMRPARSLSSDGALNFFNAVATATTQSSRGKGVLVVANGHIYGARDVMKRDTSSIDAIQGSKFGILGEVREHAAQFFHSPVQRHTASSEFEINRLQELPQVDILFDHQAAGTHLCRASVEAGSKAIVVAGMGNGSLSPGLRKGAALARDAGVIFIRASRSGQGIVAPLHSDAELGIITAGSLPPQKARILAMLGIAHAKDIEQLQRAFDSY